METADYSTWFDKVYPELHCAGLWLRGGEINTLPADERDKRDFRVLFARLSTYQDTASSATHGLLYAIARGIAGVFPDLAYLPHKQDAGIMTRDRVPWLIGTQSKLPPQAFDLIGFSNSIVQELVNLPAMLRMSGIPLLKSERLARPDLPLVILGGANALHSTALWGGDPPVDGVFAGESRELIARIVEICRDSKQKGISKAKTLAALASKVPGFVLPDQPSATVKQCGETGSLDIPVPFSVEQAGSGTLSISDGCPCFCSFCAESWARKPYRERATAVLMKDALATKTAMGLDSIDLYAFNFNMHSGFFKLMWDLLPLFRTIGLKSQRLDLLAREPAMAAVQHAAGKSAFTFGIEGISHRLRNYLGKSLDMSDIRKGLESVLATRPRELKLFYIATGLEADSDYAEFSEFMAWLKSAMTKARTSPRVVFSMTPLVRFPWTPLEFEDAPDPAVCAKVLSRSDKVVKASGFEFRSAAEESEYLVSQILARADDPRVFAALSAAQENTGFLHYRGFSHAFVSEFQKQLQERGFDVQSLLRGFGFKESGAKPWTMVSAGVKREFLWTEFQRAGSFADGGHYPAKHRIARDYKPEEFAEHVKSVSRDQVEVSLLVRAGQDAIGLPRKFLAVALSRAMMMQDRALAEGYRGVTSSWWDDSDGLCRIAGLDVLTLRWNRKSATAFGQQMAKPVFLRKVNSELAGWGELVGPGAADWMPGSILLESEYDFRSDEWFRKLGLKFAPRRTDRDTMVLDLAPVSVKKGIVAAVEIRRQAGGASVRIEPGPKFRTKFDLREVVTSLFVLPRECDWVRIRATSA